MSKKTNTPLFEEDDDVLVDDNDHKVVYVLCLKNEARGRVYDADGRPLKDPEYPKRRNLLLRSTINWPGGKDPYSGQDRPKGRYLIRYYDGCDTLFVDNQPKEPLILEPMMAGTRELHFINGFLYVDEYDTMLRTYCDWCSWNADSKFRNKQRDAIFRLLDSEEIRREESAKIDLMEQALVAAKTAKVKHMRIHAKFLNIPEVDENTNRVLSDDAIRTLYRQSAMHDPAGFMRTFNDKSIHLKYWIEKALASGELSTTLIPNRTVWAKKGADIGVDMSGIQTTEGIMNKLIEFAQTDAGMEFREILEALYNK